jgi:hypothetical protein
MTDLKTLIDTIANQADEILEGCTNPSEARTIILEHLTAKHRAISIPDRRKIADQVTALLQNEGFFDASDNGDSWDSDDKADNAQSEE